MDAVPLPSENIVGFIPSGLFIVCVHKMEYNLLDGYLASWIQQTSFKPLLISLAIKPGRPVFDLINQGHPFTVNIVGEKEKKFLKHFWGGYDCNKNPFQNGDVSWKSSPYSGVLITDAKAALECQKISLVTPGDHHIIFAEVLRGYEMNKEVSLDIDDSTDIMLCEHILSNNAN
jgi:flavin reductase (DIM6/NTAB) family NADH-FMN oxidoreductase RutF